MAYNKTALIRYRIERARETLEEVEMALEHSHFNLAENRIYYGMFYMVQAVALHFDFSTVRHAQLLGWFNKSFIRTGKVDVMLGKAYQSAFDKRQEGDYQDFVTFEKAEVEHDLKLMRKFLDAVEALIN